MARGACCEYGVCNSAAGGTAAPEGVVIRRMEAEDDERELLAGEHALLFKYSPICWISEMAAVAVQQFAHEHPDLPVHVVDVLVRRDLSQRLARKLRIEHESPQVIVLRRGKPVETASHLEITTEWLERSAQAR